MCLLLVLGTKDPVLICTMFDFKAKTQRYSEW